MEVGARVLDEKLVAMVAGKLGYGLECTELHGFFFLAQKKTWVVGTGKLEALRREREERVES